MLGGQFFIALLILVEEYMLDLGIGQDPLKIVGWEGIFGAIITMLLLVPA